MDWKLRTHPSRGRVQLSAPLSAGSYTPATASADDLTSSSGLQGSQAHTRCRHTHKIKQ